MNEHPTPTSEPQPPPASAATRRWPRLIPPLVGVLVVMSLPIVVLALVYWAASSPGGTAWLLNRIGETSSLVQVSEPQGALLGDFSARQIVVNPSKSLRIVIDQPRWRGLSAKMRPQPRVWALLQADSASAQRVTVSTKPSEKKPVVLPQQLHLRIMLNIGQVRIDELWVPGLETHPLRDIRTQVQIGAGQGGQYRLDSINLQLDSLQIRGYAHLGVNAPLPLDISLKATQITPSKTAPGPSLPQWAKPLRTDWQAQLIATGPLARFQVKSSVRAQGQHLEASAQVAPAEAWPLPQLMASTTQFDLSALLENAPVTALSGSFNISPNNTSKAGKTGFLAQGKLTNALPGPWSEQHLPVSKLALDLHAQPGETLQLELSKFEAWLTDGSKDSGSLKGQASWSPDKFELSAQLHNVQPGTLDPRLPAMTLSGPIKLSAAALPNSSTPPVATNNRRFTFTALADIKGQLSDPARSVELRLNAKGDPNQIELHELQAVAGGAQATVSGRANLVDQKWHAKGLAVLVDFDPLIWFRGTPNSAWHAGPHKLNLRSEIAVSLPQQSSTTKEPLTLIDRLYALDGQASAKVTHSLLAGVPLSGDVTLSRPPTSTAMRAAAALDLGGNLVKLDGLLTPKGSGNNDRWTVAANVPNLARLTPVLKLLPAAQASGFLDGLAGTFKTEVQLTGRWPHISTQGTATLSELHAGALGVAQGNLNWQVGSSIDAPLEVKADMTQLVWGTQELSTTQLNIKGRLQSHDISVRTELKSAPPTWLQSLQGRSMANTAQPRTIGVMNAHGSLSGGAQGGRRNDASVPDASIAWKGVLQQLEIIDSQPGAQAWLQVKDIALAYQGGSTAYATLGEGRALLMGAALRWKRLEWRPHQGMQTQQLNVQAELEPLAVAPFLRRIQPYFGWGGDLQIGGKVMIHQAAQFSAEIVLERIQGDLNVTDETGTQELGLTDLRVGLQAQNGVWNFTQGLAGTKLGVAAGALVVHTSAQRAWPAANDPVQGVLEAQVANLGTWGAWVPAGWRLGGKLGASASIGGRFGAIEYTGRVQGNQIAVRHMLMGVNVADGELDVALQGNTAEIKKFTVRSGAGSVDLQGGATLEDAWSARLHLIAKDFELLGRVDRRIVTSGKAEVRLAGKNLNIDGEFNIDEGLVDFTRFNAPSLGDDVRVTGRTTTEEILSPAPPSGYNTTVNVLVNSGNNLRLRGYGIETGMRGELKLTYPSRKLALHGSVSAMGGTFAAYGQKLVIDRGVLRFNGPLDPQLDIQATRPNLDVRVGVNIIGTLLNMRGRLFSEPEMSDTNKLSWLILGRPSEGLGTTDTALLQSTVLALLAGENESMADRFTKAIGIDELSVRQKDGDTARETIFSVGKQVSSRLYVGYERSLNATAGNWQAIYRVAQRFTLRAQKGIDNSVDLIWTLHWD